MLCALLLATASLDQDPLERPELQQVVSFEHVASPAQAIVAALAKQTQLKLVASPGHSRDVVFVRCDGVPLPDLMKKIASVTSSGWEFKNGSYRLIRTSETEKRESQAEYQARLTNLARSLEILTKRASPDAPILPTGVVAALARITPALIEKIGLKKLADMENDERVVYSTSPNAMQRPLGLGHEQVMELVVSNFNKYATGKQSRQTAESIPPILDQSVGTTESTERTRDPKFLVAASRSSYGITFDVRHYNKVGVVTLSSRTELYDRPENYTPGVGPEIPELSGPNDPIQLVGAEKEIQTWFVEGGSFPSESTIERFSRPGQFHPFSFEVSSCLIQVAKGKKINLIANLPDDITPVHSVWGKPLPETVNQYLLNLMADKNIKLTHEKDWLTISPAAPHSTRQSRTDLVALERLVRSCRGTGNARLADMAEYAKACPNSAFNWITAPYFLMFCPNGMTMGERINDWDMLRLFAALGPDEKQMILEGQSFPLGPMNKAQRSILHEMLYNSRSPDAYGVDSPPSVPATERSPARVLSTWMNEPTEAVPYGPQNDMRLLVSRSTSYAAIHHPSTPGFQTGSMSPDMLAFNIASAPSAKDDIRTELKMALGERRVYKLVLPISDSLNLNKRLGDDIYPTGAPYLTWNTLPEDFRQQVENQVALHKERREAARRNRPKPPPP
jgi:hypothetical protein